MRRFASLDGFLAVTLASFATTSFAFDRCSVLDNIRPDALDPFARALYWYGTHYDPLLVANPLFLRIIAVLSVAWLGPAACVLCHGFLRRRNEIRGLGIAYAATLLYSVVVHMAIELLGDLPPPNLVVFWGLYLPYAVIPIVLLWRLRRPDPFTA
jgi:EXPERA (EXPanded EBP superfamily)